MSLLLSDEALRDRVASLRNPSALDGLPLSLQRELHEALDVPVPDGKARMTRYGGRCRRCTVLLEFDPRAPHHHRCPACGVVHTEPEHHEWWRMNGHLWTAEQSLRAAIIALVFDDVAAAARADLILTQYAALYLRWPNRDNVLGPTRPFFSTYLESIWLLHLTLALDLREAAACSAALGATVRDALVAPSAALIASYDEGRSNRQVWNAAALIAAGRSTGDRGMVDRATTSLTQLLRDGLHVDGSWYEGENYHLFAHRGLLTAVTLAEAAGMSLPRALQARFDAGFTTPFRTMLPDGTFPARRDSQYGITLRQWRTADWAECGLARTGDPVLGSALAELYAQWPETGRTARWRSTADAERNEPGVQLSRADCSWRALLLAPLVLPPVAHARSGSELLEGQGLAVFRRPGSGLWVGVDYGDTGDGHGHPDRLNLLIATRTSRWLDDVGTGSYTAPSLAWYRSSVAHNAPFVDGCDQGEASGTLLAFDEGTDIGWIATRWADPASGVEFERRVVVMPDYVLDEIVWKGRREPQVDLPAQCRSDDGDGQRWRAFTPGTRHDAWLRHPEALMLPAHEWMRLPVNALPSPALHTASGDTFDLWCWSDSSAVIWRAGTIGPPAGRPHGLVAIRQRGASGRSLRVYAAHASITAISREADGRISVTRITGDVDVHTPGPERWMVSTSDGITLLQNDLRAEISSRASPAGAAGSPRRTPTPQTYPIAPTRPFVARLGESHYRGTEASWQEADSPVAEVTVGLDGTRVSVSVDVRLGRAPVFADAEAENPLDNEPADVNSDGVQLHWGPGDSAERTVVLAVPDGDGVRLSAISGDASICRATWTPTPLGYRLDLTIPWPTAGDTLALDCCINEMPPGRERRRGQLVLGGVAPGERAYLLGPRQPASRALHFLIEPALL